MAVKKKKSAFDTSPLKDLMMGGGMKSLKKQAKKEKRKKKVS